MCVVFPLIKQESIENIRVCCKVAWMMIYKQKNTWKMRHETTCHSCPSYVIYYIEEVKGLASGDLYLAGDGLIF